MQGMQCSTRWAGTITSSPAAAVIQAPQNQDRAEELSYPFRAAPWTRKRTVEGEVRSGQVRSGQVGGIFSANNPPLAPPM